MRPGRFELPRSKRTTRPSTLRMTCPIRPNAEETHIRSARLDDLDWLDKTFVVTVLSRRRLPVLRFLSARAAAQLMLTW